MEAVARYPFPVPEWCRTIWVSAKAKELWQPRIQKISQAWEAAERASVGQFRSAARQAMAPEQFVEASRKAAKAGRVLLALSQNGSSGQYQAGPQTVVAGRPWTFTTVLTHDVATAGAFVAAWEKSDDRAIGDLLGFPPCCVEFFQQTWVEERWIDTTWPMARSTSFVHEVSGDVEANILLRWMGIRFVPHLPCSFDCKGTAAFGKMFRGILPSEEREWMDELLNASIEWSAWHGIAEIKHPLFKISAKTDATLERLIVRRPGPRVPEMAARGNVFPYLQSNTATLKIATPAPATFYKSTYWTDNGFSSLEEMRKAHQPIIDLYRSFESDPVDRVLDLGAGNGALVGDLSRCAMGVESDADRARRAVNGCAMRHGTIQEFVRQSTSEDVYDTVLIMPGRIVEMTDSDAAEVRAWLRTRAKRVIIYGYGDWLRKYPDGLKGLAKAAGMMTSAEGSVGVVIGWR